MERETSVMNWQVRHDAYTDAAATLAGCIDRAMAEGIDINTDPAECRACGAVLAEVASNRPECGTYVSFGHSTRCQVFADLRTAATPAR